MGQNDPTDPEPKGRALVKGYWLQENHCYRPESIKFPAFRRTTTFYGHPRNHSMVPMMYLLPDKKHKM